VLNAVATVLAVLLALTGTLANPAPAQAAWSRPTGLTATSTATTSVRLAWKAVSKAPAYRVKYDDNSSMRSPAYLKATSAGVEVTGLTPGRTYWFKVRVISAKSANLSSYSSTIKVTTRKTGDFGLLSPSGLAATAVGDSTLTLAWAPRGDTDKSQVRWATSSKHTDESSVRVTGPGAEIADRSPGVTYNVSVRV
ncbi:MAG: fibronectin type III domain-containing protein, partial [Actinobacteria bacterium]|nr:fibronectin type III domain-containing protein [Actinomycetota bacterium]